jgi:endonuclease G
VIVHRRIWWALLTATFSVSTAWARVEGVIGSIDPNQNPNLSLGLPTTRASEILISRSQYLISYNKYNRTPNWVAWKVEAKQIGKSGRSNKFQQDLELEEYLQTKGGRFHAVLPSDYKNSCMDRGHQVPSGDRTDSPANNEVTFEMSNMVPQTPYLNRVIWEHLETYARSLVTEQGKKLYIMAGPIYDADFGAVGPNHDIRVPSKDFKLIFILNANQSAADINAKTPYIAVIMPNTLKNGKRPVLETPNCGGTADETSSSSQEDWREYQTSIADIEKQAELTFSRDLVEQAYQL